MPWFKGDYQPSYKNQPKKIREKSTEIANEVLKTTGNEGEAIATRGPDGSLEDTSNGFEYGGWVAPSGDEAYGKLQQEQMKTETYS